MIIYIMGGKLSFAFQVVVGERERKSTRLVGVESCQVWLLLFDSTLKWRRLKKGPCPCFLPDLGSKLSFAFQVMVGERER